MDEATQLFLFVNEFCHQIWRAFKGNREMHSFYLWSDKRPGTIRERMDADAKEFHEYRRMFIL